MLSARAMISSATMSPCLSRPPSSRVVLVGVRAREEEVGDRRRLGGPELVHAGLLAVERLAELDDVRPRALELARRREEVVELLDAVRDDLLLRAREGARVEPPG